MKQYIKHFILELILPFISTLPSYNIRHSFLKLLKVKIGKETNILKNVKLNTPSNIEIGNNCVINSHVLLDGRGCKIIIGNNVDIARETNIWTLEHNPHDDFHKTKGGNVVIEDYVWIASRVTILPNVTIGKGAVIASGAIVGGIPAKIISTRKSKLKYKLYYRPPFQ